MNYKEMKTIDLLNELGGVQYAIRGKVKFSKVKERLDGEGLANRNKYSKYPTKTPYTYVTIEVESDGDAKNNPVVIATDKEEIVKEYLSRKIYVTSKGEYLYEGTNKSPKYLPYVLVKENKDESSHTYVSIEPEGELAVGSDVYLIMRIYNGSMNNGITLDGVVVMDDELRLYDPKTANTSKILDMLGIQPKLMDNKSSEKPEEHKEVVKAERGDVNITDEMLDCFSSDL